ncbi:MAG: DUF4783 domain-containing protein [Planctomycetes bacterium]|nr:DUF4783 domain-containing protein [Planctomycetota bacterium]
MKRLFTFLLAVLSLPALADDKPEDAAMAVFESVSGSWYAGNAKGVGASFDKDSKVTLSLPDDSAQYSRDQAISRLKKFFESNTTVTLKIEKDGYEGGSNPSATYVYEYTDANDKKQKGRLSISLVKKGDTWVVRSISVLR